MVLARISSFINNPRTKSSLVWKSKLSENSGGTAGEHIATYVSWRSYLSSTWDRSTYVSCRAKCIHYSTAQSYNFFHITCSTSALYYEYPPTKVPYWPEYTMILHVIHSPTLLHYLQFSRKHLYRMCLTLYVIAKWPPLLRW